MIESLFRFTDKIIKDSIMTNYENEMDFDSKNPIDALFEDFEDDRKKRI